MQKSILLYVAYKNWLTTVGEACSYPLLSVFFHLEEVISKNIFLWRGGIRIFYVMFESQLPNHISPKGTPRTSKTYLAFTTNHVLQTITSASQHFYLRKRMRALTASVLVSQLWSSVLLMSMRMTTASSAQSKPCLAGTTFSGLS